MLETRTTPYERFEFHKEMAAWSITEARLERARHHIGAMHRAAHEMDPEAEREAFEEIHEMREKMT